MLNRSIEDYEHIYIACGYTDMRKGIDGLAYIVQKKLGKDPFSNSLFLFCGRKRCFFKALSWAGNGFELYYRRYDGKGATLKWPMYPEEAVSITLQQLQTLLDGFSILPAKGFEEVKSRDLY